MLYLGIDQHRKQLTVSLRDEAGTAIERRQVSTEPARLREWLAGVQERGVAVGGWTACIEVCGFGEWLWPILTEFGCLRVLVVQPDTRSKRKTDHRDAQGLSELLWVNRQRLLGEERLHGVRVVRIPSEDDRRDRQLTALRQRLGRRRTQTINRLRHLLNKHNLCWSCPTKGIDTRAARGWLRSLAWEEPDRVELDHCLQDWELCDRQLGECERQIGERVPTHASAQLLGTTPGVKAYAALALASRIGDISRFPTPRSLGNYWGLVPSCRNSGESGERRGSITKDGSPVARFILGQLVLHVLRKDVKLRTWYKGIRQRRGSKIARVAVMRRLTTIFWHMLTHQTPYVLGGPPPRSQVASHPPGSAGTRGRPPACPTPPGATSPADPGGCRPGRTARNSPRRKSRAD